MDFIKVTIIIIIPYQIMVIKYFIFDLKTFVYRHHIDLLYQIYLISNLFRINLVKHLQYSIIYIIVAFLLYNLLVI